MSITNTGSPSTFSGHIELYEYQWAFVDFTDLPDLDAEISPDMNSLSYFYFATGTIDQNSTVEYHYQLMVKAISIGDYHTRNYVTRTGNHETQFSDQYVDPEPYKPIPFPGYSSYYASDLLEDYDGGNGPFTLFPLDPLTGSNVYACNPDLSQSLYVEDQLVFDIPEYCIYNGQSIGGIIVGSGGQIKILNGASLYIDGQTIRSCQKMWKGFYVESGGTLIMQNCTIENAQYGIQPERGATIDIRGTIFKNNYVGLYVSPFAYQPNPEEPQQSYVNSYLADNLFIGDGNMLVGYDGQAPAPLDLPYAGIEVNYLSSFEVPGHIGFNSAYANYFEKMYNGIVARHTSLYVGDDFFKDINSSGLPGSGIQGYGIYIYDGKISSIQGNTVGQTGGYSHHFENVDVGIQSLGNSQLDIYGMTMNNVRKGIVAKNAKRARMYMNRNAIAATGKGIELDHCAPVEGKIYNNFIEVAGPDSSGACIEINDYPVKTYWDIEDNDLTLSNGLYGIIHRVGSNIAIKNNPSISIITETANIANGIYLEGSVHPQVYCNSDISTHEISSTYPDFYGIYGDAALGFDIRCNGVTNFKYGLNFTGNAMQCNLQSNTIGKSFDGLLLGLPQSFGNAIIGTQNLAGNIWTEDESGYSNYAAKHLGNENVINASIFTYDTTENIHYYPPSIYAITPWFKSQSGDSYLCSSPNLCPGEEGYYEAGYSWDSLDYIVATSTLGFDHFDDPLTWIGQLYTYCKLKSDYGNLPEPIDQFLDDQADLPIGQFSNVLDTLDLSLRDESPWQSNRQEFIDFAKSKFEYIAGLDSLLLDDRFDPDSIKSIIQAKLDSVAIGETDYLYQDSVLQVKCSDRLEEMLADLDQITPDSIWEDNLKFALMECGHLALTDTVASPDDIRDLADLCPDYFGYSVLIARSLTRQFANTDYYNNESLCEQVESRFVEYQKLPYPVDIFPNPATEDFTIRAAKPFRQLDLWDMGSKNILTIKNINTNIFEVDIAFLPAGIYNISYRFIDGSIGHRLFAVIQ